MAAPPSHPSPFSAFIMSIENGESYKIVNAQATESVIDLSGMNNRDISGYTFNSGDNQRWKLTQDDGHWVFQSANGSYLGVDGPPQDGAWLIGQGDKFHWDIWPDEQDPSVFKICLPNTYFVVDLSDNGNPTPGTRVTLWTAWGGRNQFWRFDRF